MTSNATFGPLTDMTVWSYTNKLWTQGGWTNNGAGGGLGADAINNTWRSDDGVTWTNMGLSGTPPRYAGGAGNVFLDKMFHYGGNYMWFEYSGDTYYDGYTVSTTMGTSWAIAGGDLNPSRHHPVGIVYGSRLYWAGGERGDNTGGMTYLNRVDYTSDGSTWVEATSAAAWSVRSRFGGLSLNDKMWIFGGSEGYSSPTFKNDVWWSPNGTSWTQATNHAAWSPRDGFGYVVYNNKMYVIGGRTALNTATNDVWSSTDGANWTFVTNAPFTGRRGFGCVVHNNKIWVIGGNDGRGYGVATLYKDVWNYPGTVTPGPVYDTVPTNGLLMHYTLNGTSKDEVSGSNGVWMASGGGVGTPTFTNAVPSRLSAGFGYTNVALFGDPITSWNVNALEDWRPTLLNGKSCATVAFWLYHYGTAVAYDYAIGMSNDDHFLWWNDDSFYVSLQGVSWSPSQVPLDTWTHVALTSTNGQPVKLYYNGLLVSSSGTASATISQSTKMLMGLRSRVDPDYPMDGYMGQVLIYDRVLTTNEIYHLATGN